MTGEEGGGGVHVCDSKTTSHDLAAENVPVREGTVTQLVRKRTFLMYRRHRRHYEETQEGRSLGKDGWRFGAAW